MKGLKDEDLTGDPLWEPLHVLNVGKKSETLRMKLKYLKKKDVMI